MDQSDILTHYGVQGMRWGVRKAASRANSATTKVLNTSIRAAYKISTSDRAAARYTRMGSKAALVVLGFALVGRGVSRHLNARDQNRIDIGHDLAKITMADAGDVKVSKLSKSYADIYKEKGDD